MTATVAVRGLRVELLGSSIDIVDDVSFEIGPSEVLGLVGESGSGKTTTAMALLGHCRRGTAIVDGEIVVEGHDLRRLSGRALTELRGNIVSYVPQDPSAALNPALRIRVQLEEMLRFHLRLSDREITARLEELMATVHLPSDRKFMERYPHQLSGGQQQRVILATAFACRPRVIVLDEPTTGLDVTTQAHVLATLRELCRSHEVSVLYVTHDLAVVGTLADRVAVMYSGRLVEIAPRADLFARPAHPYTRHLLRAVPDVDARRSLHGIPGHGPAPGSRPGGCFFAPRCELARDECLASFPPTTALAPLHLVRCYRAAELSQGDDPGRVHGSAVGGCGRRLSGGNEAVLAVEGLTAFYESSQVLYGVTLSLQAGRCLAIVGESGSGKTTLARCIVGLHPEAAGKLLLLGEPLPFAARRRTRSARKDIQLVFQNPDSSLNPRQTVGQIVGQPLRLFYRLSRQEARTRTRDLLTRVRLGSSLIDHYPDQLSGGEKQRVAIARALAAEPKVLICDEVTSALDVSVQASLIELLRELQREMNLALLFITHNLAVVRAIADEVVVARDGRVVESGLADEVLATPHVEYTRSLLAATPRLEQSRGAPPVNALCNPEKDRRKA